MKSVKDQISYFLNGRISAKIWNDGGSSKLWHRVNNQTNNLVRLQIVEQLWNPVLTTLDRKFFGHHR